MSSSRLNLSGLCLSTAMFPIFPPLLDCNICSSLSAVILTENQSFWMTGITFGLRSKKLEMSNLSFSEVPNFPTSLRNTRMDYEILLKLREMSICAFFFFIARTFKIPFKKKNILNILWSLLFNLRRSISLHQSHRNPRGKSDPLISSQIVRLLALYVTGNAPEVDGENLT